MIFRLLNYTHTHTGIVITNKANLGPLVMDIHGPQVWVRVRVRASVRVRARFSLQVRIRVCVRVRVGVRVRIHVRVSVVIKPIPLSKIGRASCRERV